MHVLHHHPSHAVMGIRKDQRSTVQATCFDHCCPMTGRTRSPNRSRPCSSTQFCCGAAVLWEHAPWEVCSSKHHRCQEVNPKP